MKQPDRKGFALARAIAGPASWSMAVAARWVLSIGIAAAVLYGSAGPVRAWPHYVFVIAVLLGNGLLAWHWPRMTSSAGMLRTVVGADVLAVTVAIALTGRASADLYLFYFVVLLAAAATQSKGAFVLATVTTCGLYSLLLYAQMGPELWHDSALLLRIPFLLSVSIFVGLAAQRVRAEKDALDRIGRALTEIGRLGVSWGSTGQVLYAITHQIQEALAVDRCSLVLLEDDFRTGYLAASGDDPDVETRLLPIHKYPEILAAVETKEVVELYPGDPQPLWDQVQAHLPQDSCFRSFLIVPISLRGELFGVYFLRSRCRARRFAPHERTFCQAVAMMTAAFTHERELQRERIPRFRVAGTSAVAVTVVGAGHHPLT